MSVSFIVGGIPSTPKKSADLLWVTYKLYCIKLFWGHIATVWNQPYNFSGDIETLIVSSWNLTTGRIRLRKFWKSFQIMNVY